MNTISYIWELPQNLLGLLIKKIFKKKINLVFKYADREVTIVKSNTFTGISLGKYIILAERFNTLQTVRHEYGHCIQSHILGPLYLPIVGALSLTWNLLARVNKYFSKTYYKRFPENWADKLGGVVR